MGWIFRSILDVWFLGCTLFIYCLALGEDDTDCYNSCKCCKDEVCETGIFGWTNVCTKGCIDGHRGARCYELCQYTNCKSCGSRTLSKTCDACYDGFYLGSNNDCTLECPPRCKSCKGSTYCTECEEGFYDKDGSTICQYINCPANCQCNQTHCISCNNGFYGITTSCKSACPLSCDTCLSSESCSVCKNGFYNGYEQDDTNSPYLSNCKYKCREICSKCVSYDSCVRCIEGKYGPKCQADCSIGCEDKTCMTDSGKCNCSSIFSGERCTECVVGRYGYHCNVSCSKYCKNKNCDKTFGYCLDGCTTQTITGKSCDACIDGMHGDMCNEKCSVNCKNQKCERHSGVCVDGCIDRFNGTYCDVCIRGRHGEDCAIECPATCTDGVCNKVTGHCFDCINNFYGANCDRCLPGFYGADCNDRCSLQCLDGLCDIKSGICKNGCKRNYSGDKCCVGNDHCVKCSSNTNCKECKPGYFNFSCGQKCSLSCASSCDFNNGICHSCTGNMFGRFCSFKCPEKCKELKDVAISRCTQMDGMCRFGCADGHFGPACNMTCSIHCIGGICLQKTGVCTEGCNSTNDDDVCVLTSGKTKEPQTVTQPVTVQVLGSIFGLAIAAFAIVAVGIAVKRRWPFRRNFQTPELQLQFENKTATLKTNKESNMPSGERDSTYDTIRAEADPDMEETHEEVKQVEEEQDDNDTVNNIDYVNLIF